MGPIRCALCRKDTHQTLSCPQLPIVQLGRAGAPIVGFRAWRPRLHGESLRLVSLYRDAPWNGNRPTTASCDIRSNHAAPALRCTCGLYACHSLRAAALYVDVTDVVFGAVLGWGRVYLHENGWRAQHAQVLCFTSIGLPREEEIRVAAAAGLPLLPSSGVETYAAEFGVDGAALYRSG